jgi:hypothetical protein
MPGAATRNQGKSQFVRDVLSDNPRANAAIVNEAWRAAGMAGSISSGLVNNLRFRMGLSGNLRRKRMTGKRRGRLPTGRRVDPSGPRCGRRERPRRQ